MGRIRVAYIAGIMMLAMVLTIACGKPGDEPQTPSDLTNTIIYTSDAEVTLSPNSALYDIVESNTFIASTGTGYLKLRENPKSLYLGLSGCCVTDLDMSHVNTSEVVDMTAAFRCGMFDYWPLVRLDVSGMDTRNVVNMQGIFAFNELLEEIDLTGWDTSKVQNMIEMFLDCKSLKTIKGLDKLDTSGCTDMTMMFSGCRSLERIDLSVINTSKVRSFGYMFRDCTKLTEVDLSVLDMTSATGADSMFAGSGIRKLKIPAKCTEHEFRYMYIGLPKGGVVYYPKGCVMDPDAVQELERLEWEMVEY